MIRTSGLIWWIRFPVAVYMAAKSVPLPPIPQVGDSLVPPTVADRGSFLMSIAATSRLDLYRRAIFCQAAVNFAADQLSLYHRPLLSSSAQHQPPNSMWQFGMTISPAPVSAATQAS